MISLKEILSNITIKESNYDGDLEIKGIAYDSRQVRPGYLFVCIEGYKTDGHKYINEAIKGGAVAIVGQRKVEAMQKISWVIVENSRRALALTGAEFFGHPSDYLTMIGVTGTNGKTTTTHLIESILKSNGAKVGLIGTINNKIGDQILPVKNTTPESLDLQKLLREMVSSKCTHVVMEVSSHALDLDRVAGVEYDVAVFTNITQDHLDFHETMENYLQAKVKLFSGLGLGARKKVNKFAIINVDDPKGTEVVRVSSGTAITYSIKEASQIKATNIDMGLSGVGFTTNSSQGKIDLDLNMTGLFSVYNALAAVAVGLSQNIEVEVIKKSLEAIRGVAGRFETVECGQDFAVIVDYAHTPDSLENVLKTAKEVTKGKVITVFGCGGDRDKTKRPIMGEVAAKLSDYSVITSDNPRSEEPAEIIDQIEVGVKPIIGEDKYTKIVDRRKGIEYAINAARKGDIVLIAGKGHETYQIIGDQILDFDDKKVAEEALKHRINI